MQRSRVILEVPNRKAIHSKLFQILNRGYERTCSPPEWERVGDVMHCTIELNYRDDDKGTKKNVLAQMSGVTVLETRTVIL